MPCNNGIFYKYQAGEMLKMRRSHNKHIRHSIPYWFKINTMFRSNENYMLKDYAFIENSENGKVIAFVPVELLFTESKDTDYNKVSNITEGWKTIHFREYKIPLLQKAIKHLWHRKA
jgi:hypothetical protein